MSLATTTLFEDETASATESGRPGRNPSFRGELATGAGLAELGAGAGALLASLAESALDACGVVVAQLVTESDTRKKGKILERFTSGERQGGARHSFPSARSRWGSPLRPGRGADDEGAQSRAFGAERLARSLDERRLAGCGKRGMLASRGAFRPHMRGFIALLFAVVACCPSRAAPRAEEKLPPLPSATASKAVTPPKTTFTLRGQTFTLGEDHPFPTCEQPELWLTFVTPEKFSSVYCAQCAGSTWCTPDSGDESGGPWSFASSRATKDGFWCNELRYVRHAVGAELGVAVPPGRFAPYFGHQRWYSPQPSVTEADLPGAARENLEWLGEQLDGCDASGGKVTAADQRLVDDWFDANYAGRSKLPQALYSNCNRVSADEFRRLLQSEPYLRYSARTPVVRGQDVGCAGLVAPPKRRVLHVHVGAWLTGESCTECEGHEILQIVLNGQGQIIALGSVMSG